MPTKLRQASDSDSDPTRRNGDHTSKVSIRTLLVDCTKKQFCNNPASDNLPNRFVDATVILPDSQALLISAVGSPPVGLYESLEGLLYQTGAQPQSDAAQSAPCAPSPRPRRGSALSN